MVLEKINNKTRPLLTIIGGISSEKASLMYSAKMKHLKQTVYKSDLNAQQRSKQVLTNHYCNFIFGQLQQLLRKKKNC